MIGMNPYHRYVAELARMVREGRSFPLGGFPAPPRPALAEDAPRALIFSPHPDDECIIGGLALRLMREAGMRVVNVAVTQGSNKARQAGRLAELEAACRYLGFDLIQTAPAGLESINVRTRTGDPELWRRSVEVIVGIIRNQRPRVVFFPHEADWNSTHVGTHHLLVDALGQQGDDFTCDVIETEFWGAMATPNLMVESIASDVGDLMTALSFHAGEVRRNPYHLLVPAWMQDNVRRGAELVGGQGQGAPPFFFCTLFRHGIWKDQQLQAGYAGGRTLAAGERAASLIVSA